MGSEMCIRDSNYFDLVFCVGGPLSHVEGEENRKKAVLELVRVAKIGAPIFISVMGKLGVLIDSLKYWPEEIALKEHFRNLWQKGEDDMWHGQSYCHFFTADEIRNLIKSSGVEVVECVGLEGLAHDRKSVNASAKRFPGAWKNWLESHYQLCTEPSVFATSGHMLVIGRKD